MKRREFISLVGGAALVWPPAAHGQQAEAARRIGILMSLAADDRQGQERHATFVQRLRELGWTEDRNVRIETRWTSGNAADMRKYSAELVAFAPNVILAAGGSTVVPLMQATNIIPVVFTGVSDPVGGGLVASLARPGGNVTGFTAFEYAMSGKWLELLKEVAPVVKRVAVLRDASIPQGIGQFGAVQSLGPSLGVEVSPLNVRDAVEIERDITAFARDSNGGLIITGSGLAIVHRELIVTLAARYKLPAIYFERFFVADGGLISYGPDLLDQYRRAAAYVDRILKGEKPADLPVEAPTKYETAINLKTAKMLDLTVPPMLLARADAVIE
jgi:putative ABC transport system substrate-binding protein